MRFCFVNGRGPITRDGAAASQHAAKSHAAKERHARARRHRMLQYQATRPLEFSCDTPHDDLTHSSQLEVVFPPLISPLGRDPFNSFVTPLTAAEHYLLHHCRTLVPLNSGRYLPLSAQIDMTTVLHLESTHGRLFPNPSDYEYYVRRHWVPAAFLDPGMLQGLLLSACRNLYFLTKEPRYREQSLGYKVACLKSLNESISHDSQTGQARDITIAKALQMASDEVSQSKYSHLEHCVLTLHTSLPKAALFYAGSI